MLSTGDWLIPHLNGYPYPDKPALYFWILAIITKLFGLSGIAFRSLSVLAIFGAVTGVYQLGRSLAGTATGLWAATLFATTWLSLIGGHMVRMDMLVVVAAVYAWLALHHYLLAGKRGHLLTFWVLTALALAVKGPITLLFTLIPAIAWFITEKGWEGLKSLRPFAGLITLLSLVFIWILAIKMAGQDDYLHAIWYQQLVGRAVDSWSHKEPFYFYFMILPLILMPWTGLVLQGGRLLLGEQPAFARAVAFFTLLPLLGLSLISGKLLIYPLPLLPGLCIAAALAAIRLRERPTVSPWIAWPPVLFLLVISGAMLWISWIYLGSTRLLGGLASGVGLLIITGLGIYLTRSSGYHWLWGWIGLSIGVAWLVFGAFAYVINPLFSARALGSSVAQHAPAEARVGVINATRGILNYYAGRTFVELNLEEAAGWIATHRDAVLIVKTPDLKYVFGEQGISPACRVHETYLIEFKEYHVLAGC
jgi:uncharacterized membrane protein